MLNSTILFGILLFECLGTFLHFQNCHVFLYPDRNAYDTGLVDVEWCKCRAVEKKIELLKWGREGWWVM